MEKKPKVIITDNETGIPDEVKQTFSSLLYTKKWQRHRYGAINPKEIVEAYNGSVEFVQLEKELRFNIVPHKHSNRPEKNRFSRCVPE